ncbi:MAG: hypothetical protein HKO62_09165 [Gammaproteobacteria bacterium]|nr:hypothetical protein [Gammaproteobacteria bacterium]NNM00905.1 hypothetical protein [Gammaproteobacteria bacterium]
MAAPADRLVDLSRYHQIVEDLRRGSALERAAFAQVALEEMIMAYRLEIESGAAALPEDKTERAGFFRWRRGTEAFIDRLEALLAALGPHSRVSIVENRDGEIRLLIDGATLMVSSPRLEHPEELQQRIAVRLCDSGICKAEISSLADKVRLQAEQLETGWSFDDRSPPVYQTSDGLNCMFDDRRHIHLKRAVCIAVLYELRLLAEGLRAVRYSGKDVDWRELAITTRPGRALAKVRFNRNGQFFRLDVPTLARAPELLTAAQPWLRGRLTERQHEHYVQLSERVVYLARDTMSAATQ